MKYALLSCAIAIAAAAPATAGDGKALPPRASFGSARTTADIQQGVNTKLADLGVPIVSGSALATTLAYGQGKDEAIVEITDGGDVRSVSVDATRKLGARQDEIRSCMF